MHNACHDTFETSLTPVLVQKKGLGDNRGSAEDCSLLQPSWGSHLVPESICCLPKTSIIPTFQS